MLGCGVLTARPSMTPAQRLHHLYLGLEELVAKYEPEEMAVEDPFVSENASGNARSALAIGRAQAVAMLVAAGHTIPIYTYAPAKVKQAVTNHGGSDKEQVQRMVCIHLNLGEVPRPSDAADALAVAICHFQERRLARLLAKSD